MKSQDIVILLKLVSLEDQENAHWFESSDWQMIEGAPYSVRNLGASLGISKTEVSASLNRSIRASLAAKNRELGRVRANRRNIFEFVAHGLKFVFPVKPGAPERGIPTAYAAPMLEGQLISGGEDIYVWPYARGEVRGLSVKPLFRSVPEAVSRDDRLYEYLALVDAIRLGRQREVNLAVEHLERRLLSR